MQLITAPQNEAILSNVGEIGEFRIRNSAKAFNILSSGLYANKIRAIIRELSCNAVDSHVAAGKKDTPFDVHLPNSLEPWFSIRDYGTGLNHEQVTNIYTTYFESTKTDSNEFIGALGLGSKSPFSYTDNFTVTAVQGGKKGIYTAFINDQGVPSIALMMEEETSDPNGVEVKFAVEERYDFGKFVDEARHVYTHFALRPVIGGHSNFEFYDIEYEAKDIVPGVHQTKRGYGRSVAVMGNIAYPIEIPNTEKNLGELSALLSCGLEMHFGIGELDFQASREGLSYIPQTINSIKAKLVALNNSLAQVLAKEADVIPNLWDRALFLYKRKDNNLWKAAVVKYVTDTKLPTWDETRWGGNLREFKFKLATDPHKYNISLKAFTRNRGSKTCSTIKQQSEYLKQVGPGGTSIVEYFFPVHVDGSCHFVVNDLKVGAGERARYHYREADMKDASQRTIYVLEKFDKTKEMDVEGFFEFICNPPEDRIVKASSLQEKPREGGGSLGKNVTILKLEERGYGGYYRQREMTWRDAGKADQFDKTQTYYYLPLKGFEVQSKLGASFNVHSFYRDLAECGIKELQKVIYGVRKSDIEYIKTQSNWVNIEDYLSQELSKPLVNQTFAMGLVMEALDNFNYVKYNERILKHITNSNSPYAKLVTQLKGIDKVKFNESCLTRLCDRYAKGVTVSPGAFVKKFVDEASAIYERYPLLKHIRGAEDKEVAEYVNMIDTQKGV